MNAAQRFAVSYFEELRDFWAVLYSSLLQWKNEYSPETEMRRDQWNVANLTFYFRRSCTILIGSKPRFGSVHWSCSWRLKACKLSLWPRCTTIRAINPRKVFSITKESLCSMIEPFRKVTSVKCAMEWYDTSFWKEKMKTLLKCLRWE